MKKLLIMLLALCMTLSMAACGGDSDKDAASEEISEESVTVSELPDVKGMTVDEALSAVEEAGYTNVKTVLCHKEGSTKDTVASAVVMQKSDGATGFLGGQNMFEYFVPAGDYATGRNMTQYDETINTAWREAVRAYVAGDVDRAGAIEKFKADVKSKLDIVVE